MEISTPCRSDTPENIDPKIGVNDYVVDPYNHAIFCGNRSNGVCQVKSSQVAFITTTLCMLYVCYVSCSSKISFIIIVFFMIVYMCYGLLYFIALYFLFRCTIVRLPLSQ